MFPICSAGHHLAKLRLQRPAVAVGGGLPEVFKTLQASEEGVIVSKNLLDLLQRREVVEGLVVRGRHILNSTWLIFEIVVKAGGFGLLARIGQTVLCR